MDHESLRPPADRFVQRTDTLGAALARLDRTGAGLLLLTDAGGIFERTVSDGDLRRLILGGASLTDDLSFLPRRDPVVIGAGASRRDALALMNQHAISHLPVVDSAGRVLEVLDRRDIDAQILLSTPHMGESEMAFVEEAFRTNWIAPLGPNVDNFESELAALVGVKHAAAVSSGTAALHLALRLLGVARGDTVFCSTLTFAASANPILYEGARPVFIDSEPGSWNMSPAALAAAFDSAERSGAMPKAVMIVNLYGQSADMDALLPICARYGVPVIEDAAESLGAFYKGRPSGTFGRLGVFSFNGNKIITTSGGGMLMSDDEALIAKARFLATQARDPAPHYEHSELGFNYRMSNLLAGVGRGQLRVLKDRVEARRAVFERYRAGLADLPGLEWMPEPSWSRSTRWLTTCTLGPGVGMTPIELIRALASDFIEARPVWKPMHLQPLYAGALCFPHRTGEPPVADQLFHRGVCLPSGSNMSVEQVDRVVAAVRKALAR